MDEAIFEAVVGLAIFVPAMMLALWLAAKKDTPNVFSLLLPTLDVQTALSGLLLVVVVITIFLKDGSFESLGNS